MLRVTTIFSGVQGAPWYNNLFFGGSTETEALVAADAVQAFWASVDANIATGVSWAIEETVDVVDPTNGETTASFTHPETGGVSDGGINALPGLVQGLIRLRTGDYVGGREVRGRIFVPRPTENANSDPGVPGSGYVASLNSATTALRTAAAGAGELVVWSRTGGLDHVVTSSSVWSQWASLRSRRD